MNDKINKISATHAHLFQRITNCNGFGFIAGTITLDRASSSTLQEGPEYIVGLLNGRLVLIPNELDGVPEDYACSDLTQLFRAPIWTGIETPGFTTCRLIPISGDEQQQDFLIYGAFKQAPFAKKDPCGDFYILGKNGIEMTPPPASSMGHQATTLMRLPIWQIGTQPGKTFSIEPTSSSLFNELNIARKMKIDFFDGKITEEEINAYVKQNKIVNDDLFKVRGLGYDKDYYKILSSMAATGNYKEPTRITDLETYKQRNKVMREAIAKDKQLDL